MKNSSTDGQKPREPVPGDYDGILTKKEAKKRVRRDAKGKGKAPNLGGRPKGSFSLRTMIRNKLQELRGNRPLSEHLVDALVTAAITGDRNFNSSPLKLVLEHLEGKPHQTIVADVTNRDGYAHLDDAELLRIAGLNPLPPAKKAKPGRKKKRDENGS